ncbi:uncharacterized protein A4U43_C04F19700 [Asparagus officinalis]|uniref:Uncharacterized protein n=1 Tax=Asparagus officinalis TaxID=4686 RepID=A0A5P1F410_ASPOF|nr:uncharacterized protein A4U43_C04F19700 [Asparagus officinalis]
MMVIKAKTEKRIDEHKHGRGKKMRLKWREKMRQRKKMIKAKTWALNLRRRRTVYEVEDQTISRYDMLHLLRSGRLKNEVILERREAMNIEALQRESEMLRAGLAAQIICEGHEWKKL